MLRIGISISLEMFTIISVKGVIQSLCGMLRIGISICLEMFTNSCTTSSDQNQNKELHKRPGDTGYI